MCPLFFDIRTQSDSVGQFALIFSGRVLGRNAVVIGEQFREFGDRDGFAEPRFVWRGSCALFADVLTAAELWQESSDFVFLQLTEFSHGMVRGLCGMRAFVCWVCFSKFYSRLFLGSFLNPCLTGTHPHENHLYPPQTQFGEGQPALAWLGKGVRFELSRLTSGCPPRQSRWTLDCRPSRTLRWEG